MSFKNRIIMLVIIAIIYTILIYRYVTPDPHIGHFIALFIGFVVFVVILIYIFLKK